MGRLWSALEVADETVRSIGHRPGGSHRVDQAGLGRRVDRFAWLPVRLSSGRWVWMVSYRVWQQPRLVTVWDDTVRY